MKTTSLLTVFALATAAPAAAIACGGNKTMDAKADVKGSVWYADASNVSAKKSWTKVSVDQVAALRTAKKPPTILDVNSSETRAKYGVIPGATLLPSSSRYEVAKYLPKTKDAEMVFYCSTTQCTASHSAAERALDAGYSNVKVMPAGIVGWKDAGQATQQPRS